MLDGHRWNRADRISSSLESGKANRSNYEMSTATAGRNAMSYAIDFRVSSHNLLR